MLKLFIRITIIFFLILFIHLIIKKYNSSNHISNEYFQCLNNTIISPMMHSNDTKYDILKQGYQQCLLQCNKIKKVSFWAQK